MRRLSERWTNWKCRAAQGSHDSGVTAEPQVRRPRLLSGQVSRQSDWKRTIALRTAHPRQLYQQVAAHYDLDRPARAGTRGRAMSERIQRRTWRSSPAALRNGLIKVRRRNRMGLL